MQETRPSCETCIFCDDITPESKDEKEKAYLCHRHPPQVVIVPASVLAGSQPVFRVNSFSPPVQLTHWCGDWEGFDADNEDEDENGNATAT